MAGLALSLCAGSVRAEDPRKIAFVDTGNTGRSVTAEALAAASARQLKLPVAVIGRGVDQDPFDLSPEPNAETLLLQHGIDVSGHRAAQLTAGDVKHADVILTMTAKHKATVIGLFPDAKDKVFTLAEYATGEPADVADAYGKPMPVYEQVYAQIAGYLPAALERSMRR